MLVEVDIEGKVVMVVSGRNHRTSPRTPFVFEELQPIKETRTVGMQVHVKPIGSEAKIDGIGTGLHIGGRGGATGHATEAATIDDNVLQLWTGNRVGNISYMCAVQLETVRQEVLTRSAWSTVTQQALFITDRDVERVGGFPDA